MNILVARRFFGAENNKNYLIKKFMKRRNKKRIPIVRCQSDFGRPAKRGFKRAKKKYMTPEEYQYFLNYFFKQK